MMTEAERHADWCRRYRASDDWKRVSAQIEARKVEAHGVPAPCALDDLQVVAEVAAIVQRGEGLEPALLYLYEAGFVRE